MRDTLTLILRHRRAAFCGDLIGMGAIGLGFYIALHLPALL